MSTKPGELKWLWAPWRIPYLRQITKKEDRKIPCFFCAYAKQPKQDRRNLVVHRGTSCFTVLNRFPYQGGHLLVAPKAHKGDLELLTETERRELFDQLILMQRALERLMHPHGFNIGLNLGRAAGAGVPGHVHFHLVPRWNGDTNFMAAVADTKVIPQALLDLHAELQKAVRAIR